MEPKVSVAVNEKGHAVVTHLMPLSDYCMQQARTLRTMVELVSATKGADDGAGRVPSEFVKPLMDLIREQAAGLEPLFRTLDQRAYERGFDDGKNVGFPKINNQLELAKDHMLAP